jgi:predicted cupin superfamily sugar epimerase
LANNLYGVGRIANPFQVKPFIQRETDDTFIVGRIANPSDLSRGQSSTMPTAQEIIAALKLEPHPIEGGFFRETYRSAGSMPVDTLPPGYSSQSGRSFGTAIYYLLAPGTFSELHRLPTEEVFHLYLGGPVRQLQLFAGGATREVLIGSDIMGGQQPQVVVPAGVWQGSLLEPGVEFALMGATMAPGFDYADYEKGRRSVLAGLYPGQAELITRLTRLE